MPFSAIGPATSVKPPTVTTTDDTPTLLFTFDAIQGSVFAIVHVRKVGLSAETHTFTLQAVKFVDTEATPGVVSELIHQTGTTGSPTLDVVFVLNAQNELELRVTGEPATTIIWIAQVFPLQSS